MATSKPEAAERLDGRLVHFDRITVTGTEDVMMAAVPGEGRNGDRERGARAGSASTSPNMLIEDGRQHRRRGHVDHPRQRREKLGGAEHEIIPDRIEAGTS